MRERDRELFHLLFDSHCGTTLASASLILSYHTPQYPLSYFIIKLTRSPFQMSSPLNSIFLRHSHLLLPNHQESVLWFRRCQACFRLFFLWKSVLEHLIFFSILHTFCTSHSSLLSLLDLLVSILWALSQLHELRICLYLNE